MCINDSLGSNLKVHLAFLGPPSSTCCACSDEPLGSLTYHQQLSPSGSQVSIAE